MGRQKQSLRFNHRWSEGEAWEVRRPDREPSLHGRPRHRSGQGSEGDGTVTNSGRIRQGKKKQSGRPGIAGQAREPGSASPQPEWTHTVTPRNGLVRTLLPQGA